MIGAIGAFGDGRFHWTIAKACDNALMLVLFETMQASRGKTIWASSATARAVMSARPRLPSSRTPSWLDAIKQRDPDQAASRMREHLRSTRLAIFGEN